MKDMKATVAGFAVAVAFACSASAQAVYENDFSKAAMGDLAEEFLVLDGGFKVKEEGGNKFIELPGDPLETFGFLFGPTEQSGLQVSARFHGTGKGRRFPTLGVGLNGVGGYRLLVTPSKKALEILKGDAVIGTAPFNWTSDKWTHVQLQLRKIKDGEWKLEGKAWTEGEAEPKEWTVKADDREEAPAGRPSVWGLPFSGTPIRFDDLKVTKAK